MATNETDSAQAYEDLVHYIVGTLLEPGIEYKVETESTDSQLKVKILVPAKHRGKVIGRGGRFARAMRSVVSAAQIGTPRNVSVDIVD